MNIMRIGLAGSHRVGKSTLARLIACEMDLPYIPVSVSSAPVWEKSRISPADNITFAERVATQYGVLEHGMQCINAPGVYDRTFLDFVAYLYSNIDSTCSDLFAVEVDKFVEKCVFEMDRFDKIIIVQPGIPVEADDIKKGKTFLSMPYMDAMNNHVIATAVKYIDPSKAFIIPQGMININTRLKTAMDFINS